MDNYDLSAGPNYEKEFGSVRSIRGLRAPYDLTRSRRAGLTYDVCVGCLAVRHGAGEQLTSHMPGCDLPQKWDRIVKKRDRIVIKIDGSEVIELTVSTS